jgi:hypothetical protein
MPRSRWAAHSLPGDPPSTSLPIPAPCAVDPEDITSNVTLDASPETNDSEDGDYFGYVMNEVEAGRISPTLSDVATPASTLPVNDDNRLLASAVKYKSNSTSTVMTARSTLAVPQTHELLITVGTVIHCQLLSDAADYTSRAPAPASVDPGAAAAYMYVTAPDGRVFSIPTHDLLSRVDTHGAGHASFGWEWNEAVILHKQQEEFTAARAAYNASQAAAAASTAANTTAATLDVGLLGLSLSSETAPTTEREPEDETMKVPGSPSMDVDVSAPQGTICFSGAVPGAFLDNVRSLARLPTILPSIQESPEEIETAAPEAPEESSELPRKVSIASLVVSAQAVIDADNGELLKALTPPSPQSPLQQLEPAGALVPPSSTSSQSSGSKRGRPIISPDSPQVGYEEEVLDSGALYAQYLQHALADVSDGHSSKRMRSSAANGAKKTSTGAAVIEAASPASVPALGGYDSTPRLGPDAGAIAPPFTGMAGPEKKTPISSPVLPAGTAVGPAPRIVPFVVPTLPDVFNFLQAVTLTARFSPQCNLIALIYLNRLVAATGITVHAGM